MKWEKNVTTVNPQGFQNIAANGIVCADGSSPSLGIALELAPFFQDLANKTHMTHVSASLNYWACQVKSGVSTSTVKAYLDSCLTTPKQTYCPTQ